MQYVWLLLLGAGVGGFGTLIGAGGGFILMPILLLLYPSTSPATLTAVSLLVVCFNASSGSLAYARMKRVDFKSGLLFLMMGIPGSIIGAYLVNYIPRNVFNFIFGILLFAVSIFIFTRSFAHSMHHHTVKPNFHRVLVDCDGEKYEFSYNLPLGMGISLVVGVLSSMLGIGGGIIHVPAMVSLLSFPVHLATATSHFILAGMALTGTIVHIFDGSLAHENIYLLGSIVLGVITGAQLGAKLSNRVHGRWIIRSLAIALAFVAIRVLIMAIKAKG